MRLIIAFVFTCIVSQTIGQDSLQVMSFNIRFSNPKDSPNHWLARKQLVANQILEANADIVGLQEALQVQLKDLQTLLPQYDLHGVGRDDGGTKGEYSAILYNKNRLSKISGGNFWLSNTPEIPGSKGWDAAITRMVSWLFLKDKKTGKTFYHFNTHYDHVGKEARSNSSTLLLQKIAQIAGKKQAVVTGDFNAKPSDEPMMVITDAKAKRRLFYSKDLSITPHVGSLGTFQGFGHTPLGNEPIDHILVTKGWKVLHHVTIDEHWGNLYASDHYAIIATLVLK